MKKSQQQVVQSSAVNDAPVLYIEALEAMKREQLANVQSEDKGGGGVIDGLVQRVLDANCESFNKKYATVKFGGKLRIIEKNSTGEIGLLSKDTVFDHHANERIAVGLTAKGKFKYNSRGRAWFEHPKRKKFEGMGFYPFNNPPSGYYNTFEGLALQPHDKTVDIHEALPLLQSHLYNIIANNEKEAYEYLLNWLAFCVQNVGEKVGTVPILKGKQGAGKGIFIQFFAKIFKAQNYKHITQAKQITGQFNSIVENALFVFLDEALFNGDKANIDTLKTLVTEQTVQVERKGLDVYQTNNHANFIMASNHDTVIPLTSDNRRYWVIAVNAEKAKNKQYFDALKKELDAPNSLDQFMRYLLDRDLAGWAPELMPISHASQSELIQGLDSLGAWFIDYYERLKNYDSILQNAYKLSELYNDYLSYCDTQKLGKYDIKTRQKMGYFLTDLGISKEKWREGAVYKLVSVENLKDCLSKLGLIVQD